LKLAFVLEDFNGCVILLQYSINSGCRALSCSFADDNDCG